MQRPKKLTNRNNTFKFSPRLHNKDLAPINNQNWSWYNIFAFWMSDIHSIGGYTVASSFFIPGLSGWQVFICFLIGIFIVQTCANLIAEPSQITGVPYSVICRQSFGVFGSNIPAIIRALNTFAWYGIQTYLISNAMMFVLLKFLPTLSPLTKTYWLGLSQLGWYCFISIWLLQMLIFWQGMNIIKYIIDFSGPAIFLVMIVLACWILYRTNFTNISFTATSKELSVKEQVWYMISTVALVITYFSSPILNFGDFSRYVKNMSQVRYGNILGLPINFLIFSVITTVIVAGTRSIFGKIIINPIETVSMVSNDIVAAIGLITLIMSTIGINIVANFVSPSFDFSNCAPQKISFRIGGIITGIGSFVITPWNLIKSPEIIHYTLDIFGSFIGPLFGIIISDFYWVKCKNIFVNHLFNDNPSGLYWYRNGFNLNAIITLSISVCICIFINFISFLHIIANFTWIIGVLISSCLYVYLSGKKIYST
ncbi:MAG: NCS1 family nucleobase:cation symporter-1 [Pantoea sp. Brub]|nr:NCS1 family nucleobase:cation symporter-1 [Pantoea sp. Brub]